MFGMMIRNDKTHQEVETFTVLYSETSGVLASESILGSLDASKRTLARLRRTLRQSRNDMLVMFEVFRRHLLFYTFAYRL
jgi:hypothetical protein